MELSSHQVFLEQGSHEDSDDVGNGMQLSALKAGAEDFEFLRFLRRRSGHRTPRPDTVTRRDR